jgi:PKD repeat protein
VLTVHSALVSGTGGASLGSDQTYNFFRLFGDFYGTGTVTNADYSLFKTAYKGGAAAYVSYFDFDGNGVIDVNDFNQFEADLGKSV